MAIRESAAGSRTAGTGVPLRKSARQRRDQVGLMFWFTRNRFFGSYFALIDARRA
jgi:hypothetical protein